MGPRFFLPGASATLGVLRPFMMSLTRILRLGAPLVALLLVGATASAQTSPSSTNGAASAPLLIATNLELTTASIQSRLASLQDSEGLPEADRTEAIREYKEAIAQLDLASQWRSRATALERLREGRARILEKTWSETEVWARTPPTVVAETSTLAEVEASLAESEADLTVARQSIAAVDTEMQNLSERRLAIPAELALVGGGHEDVLGELSLPALPLGSVDTALARRAASLAREKAVAAQQAALELELSTYEARRELLMSRRDLLKRKVDALSERVAALQAAQATRREAEAEKAAAAARADREALAKVDPVLGELAEGNARLTEERTGPDGLSAKLDAATRELSEVTGQLQEFQSRSAGVRQKVAAAGLTDAIGLLLRKEKGEIYDVVKARGDIRARRQHVAAAQLEALNLQDLVIQLPEVEAEVDAILARRGPGLEAAERRRVETTARNVLKLRRSSLEALIRDYNSYFTTLVDLDAKEGELVELVVDYAAFVDQHVLWIPSSAPPDARVFREWPRALAWLVDPDHFLAVARRLEASAFAHPIRAIGGVLFFVLLLGYRRRLRHLQDEFCSPRAASLSTRFPAPIGAFLVSALIAGTFPLIAVFVGSMLSIAPYPPDDFSRAVAQALLELAFPLFMLELLRRTAGRNGPARYFFGWPEAALQLARRQMVFIESVGLPSFFVAAMMDAQPQEIWSHTVGRAGFCLGTTAFGLGWHRLLSPRDHLLEKVLRRADLEWVRPIGSRLAWIPGLVTISMVGIALAGYYYTALVLMRRVWITTLVLIAFFAANSLLLRWLEGKSSAASADDGEEALDAKETAVVSVQTRSLLRIVSAVGLLATLFLVWVEVFPALAYFNRIELWHVTSTVQQTVGVGEAAHLEQLPLQVPVTAANVLLALLGLTLAVVGARNLPGLLELTFLSQTKLDRGLRYAIATLSRYAVSILGAVVVFRNLGVDWASVQWLVAAVSVGLGFGLQEIFANFVSGLILLLERPVRVGDTVTLGGVTGTVNRIHMRATTIIDFDRKELIVPNKEFITGQLVNWSLTDPTVRLVVPVGVAYGSDTAAVERILYEVAKQSARVLENPPPLVVFMSFGDSSLNFEMRVFLPNPDFIAVARHELLLEIDRKFRAAKIEIPFPQRDLHLRSVDARAASAFTTATEGEA